jgi:predicted TIM-barrel fold metal-dependent hydrolase
MIIDAHTHIGADLYAPGGPDAGSPAAPRRYVEMLRDNGVDKGFAFTMAGLSGDPVAGNDELARARDLYPDVVLPWGTVDPQWHEADLRREMRRCIEDLGFWGFKLHPWMQGFSLATRGMHVVAEECIDLSVPVTFHDGSPLYCTALQVVYYARAYPALRVLSGHGGLREGWRDIIEPAKQLDNYWICLSGPTQQGIQSLYDALGPDRLLFGSDGGFSHPAVIANYLRRIRALDAPQADIDRILGLNAARFLGLDLMIPDQAA